MVFPPFFRVLDPFFALICRDIEVTATIYVPWVVNGRAKQLANKVMETWESKVWPCVYMNLFALFAWVLSRKGAQALTPAVPQAARMGGWGFAGAWMCAILDHGCTLLWRFACSGLSCPLDANCTHSTRNHPRHKSGTNLKSHASTTGNICSLHVRSRILFLSNVKQSAAYLLQLLWPQLEARETRQ